MHAACHSGVGSGAESRSASFHVRKRWCIDAVGPEPSPWPDEAGGTCTAREVVGVDGHVARVRLHRRARRARATTDRCGACRRRVAGRCRRRARAARRALPPTRSRGCCGRAAASRGGRRCAPASGRSVARPPWPSHHHRVLHSCHSVPPLCRGVCRICIIATGTRISRDSGSWRHCAAVSGPASRGSRSPLVRPPNVFACQEARTTPEFHAPCHPSPISASPPSSSPP